MEIEDSGEDRLVEIKQGASGELWSSGAPSSSVYPTEVFFSCLAKVYDYFFDLLFYISRDFTNVLVN